MRLKDFAAVNAPVAQCGTCRLPKNLLQEVHDGIDAGTSDRLISLWLKSKGFSISETAVKSHRRNHYKKGRR